MKVIGYADPPYPNCRKLYRDQPDYTGEVDHVALVSRLESDFDGWVLHTSSPGLKVVVPLLPADARIMAWVKPNATYKTNVSVTYAWEPVVIKAARKPRPFINDWIECSAMLGQSVLGTKPELVCHWAFNLVGAEPTDELRDLFPGSGAVMRAWISWRNQLPLWWKSQD